jgi:hypothetical protein
VLADLPDAREAVLLECSTVAPEQKAALRLPVGGHLGDSLDQPAAQVGDLAVRGFSAARAMP